MKTLLRPLQNFMRRRRIRKQINAVIAGIQDIPAYRDKIIVEYQWDFNGPVRLWVSDCGTVYHRVSPILSSLHHKALCAAFHPDQFPRTLVKGQCIINRQKRFITFRPKPGIEVHFR